MEAELRRGTLATFISEIKIGSKQVSKEIQCQKMLSGYHHEYCEYLFQFYAKIWRLNCDRSKSLCGGKRKPVWVRVVGGCVSVCTVYRGKEVTELLLSLPEPESLPSALSLGSRQSAFSWLRLRRFQEEIKCQHQYQALYRYNSQ